MRAANFLSPNSVDLPPASQYVYGSTGHSLSYRGALSGHWTSDNHHALASQWLHPSWYPFLSRLHRVVGRPASCPANKLKSRASPLIHTLFLLLFSHRQPTAPCHRPLHRHGTRTLARMLGCAYPPVHGAFVSLFTVLIPAVSPAPGVSDDDLTLCLQWFLV